MSEQPSTWDLYRHAVDEVHAQLTLKEARSARLLTFVALILAAGVGLRDTKWSALVFLLGSANAVFALLAVRVDHSYYRSVRDRMVELADRVDAEVGYPATPRATPGQGSGRTRLIRVQTAQTVLFIAMATAGLVGAWGVLAE